jgi:hypothetical protein
VRWLSTKQAPRSLANLLRDQISKRTREGRSTYLLVSKQCKRLGTQTKMLGSIVCVSRESYPAVETFHELDQAQMSYLCRYQNLHHQNQIVLPHLLSLLQQLSCVLARAHPQSEDQGDKPRQDYECFSNGMALNNAKVINLSFEILFLQYRCASMMKSLGTTCPIVGRRKSNTSIIPPQLIIIMFEI